MFWATGALSSFLDNTPTYLVFMTTAGALGAAEGVVTTVGTIAVPMLIAISCGAVFMGANTYIGNAPNFMVKSIADENGVKMPSFFGYMAWSVGILIPVFLIDTLLFFLCWKCGELYSKQKAFRLESGTLFAYLGGCTRTQARSRQRHVYNGKKALRLWQSAFPVRFR